MLPAVIVFLYLGVVLYIGIFAFRRREGRRPEDYFLAGRSLGSAVFLLSLFGTNMTAFSILGASGHAFANGIVTFGLMASSSALVIPLTFLFVGTRMWALGKKYGFMTPVQMFRDRWECGHIGTADLRVLQAVAAGPLHHHRGDGRRDDPARHQRWAGPVLARRRPRGAGGHELRLLRRDARHGVGQRLSDDAVPGFGAVALGRHRRGMGGFGAAIAGMLASPSLAPLLTRERVSPLYFFSYTFIPLSSIAFPAHRHLLPDRPERCRTSGKPSSSTRSACWPSGCRPSSSAWWRISATDVPAIRDQARGARDSSQADGAT